MSNELVTDYGGLLSLARNLDFIEKIITRTVGMLRRLHDFGPDPFDLSAFDQIVGNYAVTLEKCNAIVRLKDKIAYNELAYFRVLLLVLLTL